LAQSINVRFGYNGTDPTYKRFMWCPSSKPDSYYDQTYGVSYWTLFAYYIPPFTAPYFSGSAKLANVPGHVFIAADVRNRYGPWRSEILHPLANGGAWNLNSDYDGDGVNDSASGEITAGAGPYNAFNPVHNRGGNFLFADGSVRRVSTADWARNKDGMWGSGDPAIYK
jgi:prepilin-type processing-associated H-X9-DG protein